MIRLLSYENICANICAARDTIENTSLIPPPPPFYTMPFQPVSGKVHRVIVKHNKDLIAVDPDTSLFITIMAIDITGRYHAFVVLLAGDALSTSTTTSYNEINSPIDINR